MKLTIFLETLAATLLFAAETGTAVNNQLQGKTMNVVNVSPYLEEVLNALKPIHEVQQANTAAEKQEALLAYFKTRNRLYSSSFPKKLDTKLTAWAHDALEHKFVGSPAYPTHFRGKDEIDWDSNPYSDYEWIWQFHRFYWFQALQAAYLETKDERYAKEWIFDVNSWIKRMHPYEPNKFHPGWRDLDLALRLQYWSETFDTFVQSPSMDSCTLVNLLFSAKCHLELLASFFPNGTSPTAYNWQIYELEGLITGASVFHDFIKSKEWAKLTVKVVLSIQQRVILPDGVINEYIPSYHKAYPKQFLFFMNMCKLHQLNVPFPQSYVNAIEKTIQAVLYWSHPDGTSPLFGDAWLSAPNADRAWMSQFLTTFPTRKDFLWFATQGKEGSVPQLTNYALPDAGYYMLRSGWESQDIFMVVKNTRPKKEQWHNQDDNLTFELSAYGHRLMTDSGCYVYTGNEKWRAWFRSPMAHQLVSIDNEPISGTNAKFIARDSSTLAETLVLENEPYPGLLHRRTFILLDKRYIVLFDTLSGKKNGRLRQHFQLLPGNYQKISGGILTQHTGKANLLLLSAASSNITMEEEEGWISYYYMKKEKRPAFAFVQDKPANQTIQYATALLPLAPNTDAPTANITLVDNTIRLTVGQREYSIALTQENPIPNCSRLK